MQVTKTEVRDDYDVIIIGTLERGTRLVGIQTYFYSLTVSIIVTLRIERETFVFV
jgi:hypothetical protein